MCGVFGIIGYPSAKEFLDIVLKALQHRGHDAVGIAGLVSEEPRCIETVKGKGKVRDILSLERLEKFVGNIFIAHTRYSTRNQSTSSREIHPHWAQSLQGRVAVVSNGDLLDIQQHKVFLNQNKIRTYTENDAEIMASLINYQMHLQEKSVEESVCDAMKEMKGGYAALMMLEQDNRLLAFRDPWGIRPLQMAKFNFEENSFVVFGSETCVFEVIKRYLIGKYPEKICSYTHREVMPGEIILADSFGNITIKTFHETPVRNQGCIFESIYFSRPDSIKNKTSFQTYREQMGIELFKESPVSADLVTAVPKGGIPAAIGFSKASSIPYGIGILEEPSIGGIRSFTTNHKERNALAKMKYSILEDVVRGKKIVVVDDSIVRGTTMRGLVKSLFEKGAKEVHLRIPCPPYAHSCHYGIATKDPTSLISYQKSTQDICHELGATSLVYLSVKGLYQAMKKPPEEFCDECLSGTPPFNKPFLYS